MKILTVPEETEILRRKSQPIEKLDAELLAFLTELGETLKGQKDPAGVGLSAIQVGHPIRVFATYLPETASNESSKFKVQSSKLSFYVNPEIVGHAAETTLGEELIQRKKEEGRRKKEGDQRPFLEGCLSIPRIYGAVLRYPWIKAKAMVIGSDLYYNGSGRCEYNKDLISEFRLGGLTARVFQHELDHLNGILFTDHVLAQGNKFYREIGKEMVEMEI